MLTNWRRYARAYVSGVLDSLTIVGSVYRRIKLLNLKWLNAIYLYAYDKTAITVGQTSILALGVAVIIALQSHHKFTAYYIICVAIMVAGGVVLHASQRLAEADESGKRLLDYNAHAYANYEGFGTDIAFFIYMLCLLPPWEMAQVWVIMLWYYSSAIGFQLRPRRPRKSKASDKNLKSVYA